MKTTAYGIALTFAAGLASACQTAPLGAGVRAPASAEGDAKTIALLRNDAAELIGVYAHSVFLETVRKRIVLERELGKPVPARYHFGAIALTGAFSAAGTLLASTVHSWVMSERGSIHTGIYDFSGKQFGGDSSETGSSTAKQSRLVLPGVSIGGSVVGGIALSVDPAAHRSGEDPFGLAMSLLRRKDVAKHEQSVADGTNLQHQTRFLAQVKASVAGLTRRVAALFHLNGIETKQFAHAVEDRWAEMLRSDRTWRPGDEIQVDLKGILRNVSQHGEDRIEALVYVLDNAPKEARPIDFSSPTEVVAWLETSEKGLRALEGALLNAYDALHAAKNDPRAKELMPKYAKLTDAIDGLAQRFALHAKLIREGKQ